MSPRNEQSFKKFNPTDVSLEPEAIENKTETEQKQKLTHPGIWKQKNSGSSALREPPPSYVKAEHNHVAVSHHIAFTFLAHLAGVAGALFTVA